jgi:hypothetical protein
MPVVILLPSWSTLSELVEPREVRAVPATSLSKRWLGCLSWQTVDC